MNIEQLNEDLIDYIKFGLLEKIKSLIQKGADVNYKYVTGKTSIMYACIHNYFEVVTYLVQNGADLNIKVDSNYDADYTALKFAIKFNNHEIVKYLTKITRIQKLNKIKTIQI